MKFIAHFNSKYIIDNILLHKQKLITAHGNKLQIFSLPRKELYSIYILDLSVDDQITCLTLLPNNFLAIGTKLSGIYFVPIDKIIKSR